MSAPEFMSAQARIRLALVVGILLSACTTPARGPAVATDALPALPVVASVDLARYAGTWHEIARTPFAIQDRCVRDTQATYVPLAPDRIAVRNRCTLADGREFAVEGVARVVDPRRSARLEVSFLPAWLRWLPIGRGDYWIIDLAADYSWVIIGEPRRRYLWILARTPQVDPALLDDLLGRLPAFAYDPRRIRLSPGR